MATAAELRCIRHNKIGYYDRFHAWNKIILGHSVTKYIQRIVITKYCDDYSFMGGNLSKCVDVVAVKDSLKKPVN